MELIYPDFSFQTIICTLPPFQHICMFSLSPSLPLSLTHKGFCNNRTIIEHDLKHVDCSQYLDMV